MEPVTEEHKGRIFEYVLEHGDDLTFTKYFWRECEPLPIDISQYSKFTQVLRLHKRGLSGSEIRNVTGVKISSVYKWARLDQMPKLAHFLTAFFDLSPPQQETVWLTLEQTHGHAIPIGRFVRVPLSVKSWADVGQVVNEISLTTDDLKDFNKYYLFGFLIGMIIGDASKSKQGRGHRHIGLVLSKKYATNLKIGEFTSQCAHYFGLRMHRSADQLPRQGKPHGFYEWISQSSPFIDWIYHVALGLKEGELTTYDPVVLDWAIDAPHEFRVGLIQGIAESDGSVSIASQTVEFWIIPNWDFLIRLLATFGLRGFRNREAVSLVKSQAIASYLVPVFSPHLKTVRFQKLEVLATTPRLGREDRIPVAVRERISQLAQKGLSVPRIVEMVAELDRVLVSFEAAQRWALKARPSADGTELAIFQGE